jgi:large subunit ribosomal protein L3
MREHRPRRGSMAFYPRKRAKRIYPTQNFPRIEGDKAYPLGFAGYKAGMTHVILIDEDSDSPTYGQKVFTPVTVLECPPLTVFGFRCYTKTWEGLKTMCDIIAQNLDAKLQRKTTLGKGKLPSTKPEDVDLDKVYEIRLLCHTNPPFKKTPEIFEIGLAGNVEAQFSYACDVLGKQINVNDVFKEGDWIDVTAVTKGKGTEGPVRRFGVKLHGRKMKQMHRHVGSLGSRGRGRVLPTVPNTGQMGFQTRTELNKRIIKFVEPDEINPKGGFPHYGILRNLGVLVEGSVPGCKKRLVRFRFAIRPPKKNPPINLAYISLASKQGFTRQ